MNNILRPSTHFCALLTALLLSACASVAPYQPLRNGVGYTDQKLETNRYRISFSGNSSTPRETVANYVLYRAAEVTLSNGYDYFTLAAQSTDQEVKGSGGGFGFGFGGVSVGRNGGLGIGFGTGSNVRTEYQGSADVAMYRGKKPANNAQAYDAREVKNNLDPTIKRPEAND